MWEGRNAGRKAMRNRVRNRDKEEEEEGRPAEKQRSEILNKKEGRE